MIKQILVDPQDTNRLLAAAGYYGPYLFETSNRGATWSYQDGLIGFGRIVQDPVRSGNMYSGTFGTIWKTVDGGRTWISSGTGLPPSAAISAVAVAPSAPDTVYAVTQTNPAQVYRSLDAGAVWTLVSSTLSSFYVGDLACDPFDPSILFAAGDSDVFKSVDGGATFAPTGLNRYPRRIVIDARPPGALYVGTGDSGVFQSPDAGATWNPVNTGMENHLIWDLALDPADPLRLFAASGGGTGSSGGLFVTGDGGQTWTPVDLGIPVLLATAVSTDPVDPSRVYAGAGNSVLKGSVFVSADGGSSWTVSDRGLSGYYSYGVAGHPTQGGVAYGLSGSRVFRTDDSGANWTERAETGYGVTSLLLDPSGADTLYAGYVFPDFTGDGVLKSIDGGATWNPATDGLAVSDLRRLAVSPSAPDHLLAASFDGLFGTLDGGGLWSPLLSGDVSAAAFDPADETILYAGFYSSAPVDNGILRSADGGMTWSPPAGIPMTYPHVNDIAAPPDDPLRVYAAAYTGIFRSEDRGLNFAPANTGLPAMPGIVPFRLVPDPSVAGTLYLLAALGGEAAPQEPDAAPPGNVFRTTNGADSWTQLPGFLPVLGNLDFSISATGRTLYAATTSGVFQFDRSFLDVADADPFWPSVDAAAMNGVTAGCGGGKFCPDDATLRSSIAVFLLRAKNGASYAPPPATGTVFVDVSADAPAAPYIEELFHEGITAGCGGGAYCPDAPDSRAEAAVLLLKMEHGSEFVPPPATGLVFGDVAADAFAADWIEQLALEGITAGCGSGNFCPAAAVSRAQAAAFVTRAFGLS